MSRLRTVLTVIGLITVIYVLMILGRVTAGVHVTLWGHNPQAVAQHAPPCPQPEPTPTPNPTFQADPPHDRSARLASEQRSSEEDGISLREADLRNERFKQSLLEAQDN